MQGQDKWILENRNLDFLYIIIPGFIGTWLARSIPETSAYMALYAFFAIVFVDTGHTYMTWWRTIFRREERSSHPIYWITPVVIVLTFFLWIKFKIPYLWSMVIYSAIFHQIRQYYGVARWYQKLNGRFCRISNYFLYALLIIPSILFHFRGIDYINLYSEEEMFLYPSQTLFHMGLPVYFLVLIGWLVFEISLLRKGIRELNRFLGMLAPIFIYGYGFLTGTTIAEVVFPILLAHGIPYLVIMDVSLRRLNPKVFRTSLKVIGLLVLTAVVFSVFEEWATGFLETIGQAYKYKTSSSSQALLTGIIFIPLFSHFIWDAYIWRGKHHEAKVVYTPKSV